MNASRLIEKLATLQPQDLKRVRAMLDLLDKSHENEGQGDCEMFWAQLELIALERGIPVHSIARARNSKNWAQFKRDAERSVGWIVDQVQPRNKTEKVHSVRLLARAVLTRCSRLGSDLGIDVTTTFVMRQASNAVSAAQGAWPGGPPELRLLIYRR